MCLAPARHGVYHTTLRCIRARPDCWLATATIGGLSRKVAASRGFEQGWVLSPLLWSFVVNEMLARINEGSVYSQGYAEEICFLAAGKFPNTVSGLI